MSMCVECSFSAPFQCACCKYASFCISAHQKESHEGDPNDTLFHTTPVTLNPMLHQLMASLRSLGYLDIDTTHDLAALGPCIDSNIPTLLPTLGTHFPSPDTLFASLGGATLVPVEEQQSSTSTAPPSTYGGTPRSEVPLATFLRGGDGKAGYLKDYRLPPTLAASSYTLPPSLCEDALNPHLDGLGAPSFRFLYAGWQGTRTPLHHDILASHSWSVNLSGVKLWLMCSPTASERVFYPSGRYSEACATSLLPPALLPLLRNACVDGEGGVEGDVTVSGTTIGCCSTSALPLFQTLPQAILDTLLTSHPPGTLRAVIQGPRQGIFIPSGWHHEVFNVGLGLTTSINHNWLSFCSSSGGSGDTNNTGNDDVEVGGVRAAWAFLKGEMKEIRGRLDGVVHDPQEKRKACERMLETDAGMGYCKFAGMLGGALRRVERVVAADRGEGSHHPQQEEEEEVEEEEVWRVAPYSEGTAPIPLERARVGVRVCRGLLEEIFRDEPTEEVARVCREALDWVGKQ